MEGDRGAAAPPRGPIMASNEPARAQVVAFIALAALWATEHLAVVLAGLAPVQSAGLSGPDSLMRVVRIHDLIDNGGWFDETIHRMNAPYGAALHWTRPYDLILLAGALPLAPFVDLKEAVVLAAAWHAPVFHLLTAAVVIWACRPLRAGSAASLWAGFAFFVQPALLTYSAAGRADHHALQFLVFALLSGLTIRVLADAGQRRLAGAAGAVAGLAVWISVESLFLLAIVVAIFGLAWLRDGDRARLADNRAFAAGLLATGLIALAVEYPPARWTVAVYDKISIVHVSLFAMLALAWLGAALPGLGDRRRRLAYGLGASALAVAVTAMAFPKFFGGPMVDVDPAIERIWMDHVAELRPLWPVSQVDLGRMLVFIGPMVLVLPGAAFFAWRRRALPEGAAWAFVVVALAAFALLALIHVRFAPFAEILIAIALGPILIALRDKVSLIGTELAASVARVALTVAALIGFTITGTALSAAEGPSKRKAEAAACPYEAMAEHLAAADGLGARPRIVLAYMDYGPLLLLTTPHAVIGAPYHRNRGGIVDSFRIMGGDDMQAVATEVGERGIELIVLCPSPRERAFARADEPGLSLYERLADDDPPAWLRPVELPDELKAHFRLYRVGPSS